MEISAKGFDRVEFLINSCMLVRVHVNYRNKKEANKICSLVVLKLLSNKIYKKCELG
jgi:hypothetical protein